MSSLDDIIRGTSSFMHESFGDYDDFEPLPRPEVTSEKSRMTNFIRQGKVDADTCITIPYKGNTYTSLRDLGDSLCLDVNQIINAVKEGMSFGQALKVAEDLEDYSELIERAKTERELARQKVLDTELRQKENRLQEDINSLLRVLNREVKDNVIGNDMLLIGICRRDFLKLLAKGLHSGNILDIRILGNLPTCSLSNFVWSLESFLKNLEERLNISCSKSDVLTAYYSAFYVEGVLHDLNTVESMVAANINKDYYDIMSEREEEIISTARTNEIYSYLERNRRKFVSEEAIRHKTVDGWYEDLARELKIPVHYLRYLADDCKIPLDWIYTCQKIKYEVYIQSIDYTFSCLGFHNLEKYFDIYVDRFLQEFKPADVSRPVDVTDLVMRCSAEHLTKIANTSVKGGYLKMTLLSYYNRREYGDTGINYIAEELKKNPNFVLD